MVKGTKLKMDVLNAESVTTIMIIPEEEKAKAFRSYSTEILILARRDSFGITGT